MGFVIHWHESAMELHVFPIPIPPPRLPPFLSSTRSLDFYGKSAHFSSVQSLSRVRLFATPWTAALQASLSITNSRSPPKPMSIELVMPSNHLILCHPLLLLLSIFPSIRGFSNESALHIRWPKYWSFRFNISPPSEHPGLISLQSKGLSRVFSNTTVQKHQFFCAQLSSQSNSHIHTWPLENHSLDWMHLSELTVVLNPLVQGLAFSVCSRWVILLTCSPPGLVISVGGLSLLCVLCGLGFVSLIISGTIMVSYMVVSSLINYWFSLR